MHDLSILLLDLAYYFLWMSLADFRLNQLALYSSAEVVVLELLPPLVRDLVVFDVEVMRHKKLFGAQGYLHISLPVTMIWVALVAEQVLVQWNYFLTHKR